VAVVFSTMVILNAIGGALFLIMPLKWRGAGRRPMLGLSAWPCCSTPSSKAWAGTMIALRALFICFLGTLCASAGNIIAAGNLRRGLTVLTCNSWGMFYGAASRSTWRRCCSADPIG
jgi:hypothetical protein